MSRPQPNAASDPHPFRWHWKAREMRMLHESVHQLNHELTHLRLEKWLEEGMAEYFSTCRLTRDTLVLGEIDPNTYPVWWMDDLATSPDLSQNIRNGSVIPL